MVDFDDKEQRKKITIKGLREKIAAVRDSAKWTTVRGFGNVKYFNISYGVLFIVPLLHELHQRAAPALAWLGRPGEFPTTLKWLYAASLAFALGIALYQYFCPPAIKRFGDKDDEYVRAQYDILLRALPGHRLEILLTQLDPDIDAENRQKVEQLIKERAAASEELRGTIDQKAKDLIDRLYADVAQRFLLKTYKQKNVSRVLARWASFIFYVLGTGIVLTLLIIRSVAVFEEEERGFMLIKTTLSDPTGLQVFAQTFDDGEFNALEKTLKNAGVPISFSAAGTDAHGRSQRTYTVPSNLISAWANVLHFEFKVETGQFSEAASPPRGHKYACRQLEPHGKGNGCEEFSAADQSTATTKCAVIAGEKSWFGGDAKPGTCKK